MNIFMGNDVFQLVCFMKGGIDINMFPEGKWTELLVNNAHGSVIDRAFFRSFVQQVEGNELTHKTDRHYQYAETESADYPFPVNAFCSLLIYDRNPFSYRNRYFFLLVK